MTPRAVRFHLRQPHSDSSYREQLSQHLRDGRRRVGLSCAFRFTYGSTPLILLSESTRFSIAANDTITSNKHLTYKSPGWFCTKLRPLPLAGGRRVRRRVRPRDVVPSGAHEGRVAQCGPRQERHRRVQLAEEPERAQGGPEEVTSDTGLSVLKSTLRHSCSWRNGDSRSKKCVHSAYSSSQNERLKKAWDVLVHPTCAPIVYLSARA